MLHPTNFENELRTTRKIDYDTEDSYIKNYDKKSKANASTKKAFILKGKKIKLSAITQYLTAVLIYSIYKANYQKYNGKKPIKVCIPVDLRKYFNTKTMSNFFTYITVEAEMKKNNLDTFEKILEFVVRLSYIEIRKYTTITFSNIGRMGIMGKYKDYMEYFLMLIAPEPVEKIKCSACSFEDKMVFTFTSILKDSSIEKYFYEFIKNKGIDIKIESNEVLDVISKENE